MTLFFSPNESTLGVRSGNHCGGLCPGSTEGRKKTQAEEPLSSLRPPSALVKIPAGNFHFAGAEQNYLPPTPTTSQNACALSSALD